jgi:hypothetical protein
MVSRVPRFQLLIVSGGRVHPCRRSLTSRALREKRSGRQWVNSVLAYCDYRAGDCWRRLSEREQRDDPDRWAYVDAIRAIHAALSVDLRPALVTTPAAPRPDPEIARLASKPRAWLADQLLARDPALTDRKLLCRLSRHKLARMVQERTAAVREKSRA